MNMFKPTAAKTPEEYLEMIDEPRKTELKKVYDLIRAVIPKEKPFIIAGMIGFIPYHYKGKSGREGDWAQIGLASQKNYISLYVCSIDGNQYIAEKYKKELAPASVGKSCIRFKKTADMDMKFLEKMLYEAVKLKPTM